MQETKANEIKHWPHVHLFANVWITKSLNKISFSFIFTGKARESKDGHELIKKKGIHDHWIMTRHMFAGVN